MADVGASHDRVGRRRRSRRRRAAGELEGGEALSERLIELLAADGAGRATGASTCAPSPTVIMAVGVNGTGKTTTIGKLAWHLRNELGLQRAAGRGRHVQGRGERAARRLGAAGGLRDRDRARRARTPARSRSRRSRRRAGAGIDVVIVDTAGRLHTQDDLMAELAKVRRVIARQLEGAPHETLLTIDATTGQNGLRQAKLFAEAADVSGVVLTKLDGTARGGIALAIARELEPAGEADRRRRGGRGPAAVRPEDFARALIAE